MSQMKNANEIDQVARRAFIQKGALILTAAASWPSRAAADMPPPALRVGLMTDLHYAEKPRAGTRYYRQSLVKLEEAAAEFARQRPAFVVELGDLIDAADSVEVELRYLKRINREFKALAKDRHYVLGNHCVDTLTKREFLDEVEQPKSSYSFDRQGIHFVVLDSCFRSDGEPYGRKNSQWTDANIPPQQLEWLAADLEESGKPTIVFAHQRLDVSNNYGVKNNADVRKVLQESGQVLAVFQGHSHKNDLKEIGGIPYCTLVAMVEGDGPEENGYSLLEIDGDRTIRVKGFRRQKGYEWG